MCHASKERVRLIGTDQRITSGPAANGCIQRPNTWLHPNDSRKGLTLLLHRGRRPYMAQSGHAEASIECPLSEVKRTLLQERVMFASDP